MGVSENGGTPKSSSLMGFSIINHPFWGTPIFGNTHIARGKFPSLPFSKLSSLTQRCLALAHLDPHIKRTKILPKSMFQTRQPWEQQYPTPSGQAPPKSDFFGIWRLFQSKKILPTTSHPSNHTTPYHHNHHPSPRPRHCTVSRGTFHHQSGGMIMRQGLGLFLLVLLGGLLEKHPPVVVDSATAVGFWRRRVDATCFLNKMGIVRKGMDVQPTWKIWSSKWVHLPQGSGWK